MRRNYAINYKADFNNNTAIVDLGDNQQAIVKGKELDLINLKILN